MRQASHHVLDCTARVPTFSRQLWPSVAIVGEIPQSFCVTLPGLFWVIVVNLAGGDPNFEYSLKISNSDDAQLKSSIVPNPALRNYYKHNFPDTHKSQCSAENRRHHERGNEALQSTVHWHIAPTTGDGGWSPYQLSETSGPCPQHTYSPKCWMMFLLPSLLRYLNNQYPLPVAHYA
jgi:hypothetical protein